MTLHYNPRSEENTSSIKIHGKIILKLCLNKTARYISVKENCASTTVVNSMRVYYYIEIPHVEHYFYRKRS